MNGLDPTYLHPWRCSLVVENHRVGAIDGRQKEVSISIRPRNNKNREIDDLVLLKGH
jgi:hypothetical protein